MKKFINKTNTVLRFTQPTDAGDVEFIISPGETAELPATTYVGGLEELGYIEAVPEPEKNTKKN